MKETDESELYRLCSELEQIDRKMPITETQREALKKSALALNIVFIQGNRKKLEDDYNSLIESQKQYMISLGIDPDA